MTNAWGRMGGWFGLSYWVAAVVQVAGTVAIFYQVAGLMAALSGAVCVELFILALNERGPQQARNWRATMLVASLFLVACSATFQVAEALTHVAQPDLVLRLGWLFSVTRVCVAISPSMAMALITIFKFGKVDRTPQPSAQAYEIDALPTKDDLGSTNSEIARIWAALIDLQGRPSYVNAIQVNATTQQPAQPTQPDTQQGATPIVAYAPAQLEAPETWADAVASLVARNEAVTPTTLAHATGKSKSAASRWLAQHGDK